MLVRACYIKLDYIASLREKKEGVEVVPKRKITDEEIPFSIYEKPVKVSEQGNVTQLTYMSYKSNGNNLKKLDKNHYVDLSTGEIKEYQLNDNRQQNQNGLYKTFKRLRSIINTNVTNPLNCKFITLTYAENMSDKDRLYSDFEKFNKRFLYYCKKNGISKPEYISVVEPQSRGAWHAHVIYIWPEKAPYIHFDVIADLWGHGFIDVRCVDNVDNVGAYLTAYLADLPLDEAPPGTSGTIKEVDGKKYIKGGRLHMYPSGMNLYRTSRGIKRANEYYDYHKNIIKRKKSELGTQTFRNATCIEIDGKPQYLIHEYYNRIKK